MQVVYAPRALAILYSILTRLPNRMPWLLPANICPVVPITFLKARVPFDFVDIAPDDLCMNREQVTDQLKKRKIGGVLYAHTYGDPFIPHDFFLSLKNIDSEIFIVDDRCLCVPEVDADPGWVADLTLFSTGYAKVLELRYGGGYGFIQDWVEYQPVNLPYAKTDYIELEKKYKDALKYRSWFEYIDSDWLQTQPMPEDFLQTGEWYDYRKQIQNKLAAILDYRAEINVIYTSQLPKNIQLLDRFQEWRFNIRVKNQQRMLAAIFDAGLFASAHYASLAGIMATGSAPCADALAGDVINLFNDHHFDKSKALQVCSVIQEYYEG